MDAKARVNIGSFDRGGRNRVPTETDDHDFKPKTTVAPYGIELGRGGVLSPAFKGRYLRKSPNEGMIAI